MAWNTCQMLSLRNHWNKLAEKAVVNLDIDFGIEFSRCTGLVLKFVFSAAIKAYRKMGNCAMVLSLEKVRNVEECKLLAGYVAMFLEDFDLAQQWFLKSSKPEVALEMRRDLLQWDQALQLAKKMAPEQIPYISKEYAQQLEFT